MLALAQQKEVIGEITDEGSEPSSLGAIEFLRDLETAIFLDANVIADYGGTK